MDEAKKKERNERIAEKLAAVMQIVDMSAAGFKDEMDELEACYEDIMDSISFKESALVLIHAHGGTYNSELRRCQAKSMRLLIDLMKSRLDGYEIDQRQRKQRADSAAFLKSLGMEI